MIQQLVQVRTAECRQSDVRRTAASTRSATEIVRTEKNNSVCVCGDLYLYHHKDSFFYIRSIG